jgi:predicted Fe-S protein YdhL (DUF1289 family)
MAHRAVLEKRVIDPNYTVLPEARPASPCINICSLDERGYCRGCYRTIQEIAAWPRLSHGDQWALIAALNRRASDGDRQSDAEKNVETGL